MFQQLVFLYEDKGVLYMEFTIREKDNYYYIERQVQNGTVLIEKQKYPTKEAAEKYLAEINAKPGERK